MRLLLDTHVAVWATRDVKQLSAEALDLIQSPDNEVWSSHVSLWEIAVKRARPRRSSEGLPARPQQAAQQFVRAGFRTLPIRYAHICGVAALPDGHGDPFDRLLVAQALVEPMRLVTHDRKIAAYSDTVILV